MGSLDEVLKDFPEAAMFVRAAAMKIAMQRSVVIISEYVRMSKRNEGRANQLADALGGDSNIKSGDPAAILRVITGSTARDIDADGYLIEAVKEENVSTINPKEL